jgi:hypothetical protein
MIALFKILLGGTLIWGSSEIGKRSGTLGGLILSLPLTSIFSILFLWAQTRDPEKVASMTSETLWFVLASFPLFLLLPFLLKRGIGFPLGFSISILLTAATYGFLFKIRS